MGTRRSEARRGFAKARSTRHRRAAGHLADGEGLPGRIADFGAVPSHAVPTHEAWVAHLRAAHGRKSGFWGLVGD